MCKKIYLLRGTPVAFFRSLFLLVFGGICFITMTLPGTAAAQQDVARTMEALRREPLTETHERQKQRLIAAYPDFLTQSDYYPNAVQWRDGTIMLFEDGRPKKNFETLLNYPDLQDQMAMRYTPGDSIIILPNHDPGRVRYEKFFKKMYGATEAEVRANLETVYWLPGSINQPLLVTTVNGVSEKLQALSDTLDTLLAFQKYLVKPAGTFNWRVIKDTHRLSAHSFGIAIDINVDFAHYWGWNQKQQGDYIGYHTDIPPEIFKIFEKYGFIWGGKWSHYDTMHFEYRPEMLPLHMIYLLQPHMPEPLPLRPLEVLPFLSTDVNPQYRESG